MNKNKCEITKSAFSLLLLAGIALAGPPVFAQESRHVIESRDLIGQLIPVTGDVAVVNLQIPFQIGSAALTDQARSQLDQLGMALESAELGAMDVGLFGHTDASGSANYNLALSERRAQSVRDYLLAHFRLAPEKLTARGYGEQRLLDPERPNAALNRRVEVVTTRPVMDQPAEDGGTQAIN